MAVCVCVFLHALRRLLFLDDCPSCDRRRMERGGAPAAGKYCRIARGAGAAFRADSSAASSPLRVDGYSAWSRRVARHEARLSQLEFLFRTPGGVSLVFPFGSVLVANPVP